MNLEHVLSMDKLASEFVSLYFKGILSKQELINIIGTDQFNTVFTK